MTDIAREARDHLAEIASEGFELKDERFARLNFWTYLMMLLNEAERAITHTDHNPTQCGADSGGRRRKVEFEKACKTRGKRGRRAHKTWLS